MRAMELPRRIQVTGVTASRYRPGSRPISWDRRAPGIEQVTTATGEEITLYSTGGQSTPAPGWILLLTKKAGADELAELEQFAAAGKGTVGDRSRAGEALCWTLYGIAKTDAEHPAPA